MKDADRVQTLGSLSLPLSRLLSNSNLSLDQWFQLDNSGDASRIYINAVLRVNDSRDIQPRCTVKVICQIFLILFFIFSVTSSGFMVGWGTHSSQCVLWCGSWTVQTTAPTHCASSQLCDGGKQKDVHVPPSCGPNPVWHSRCCFWFILGTS